jgi:hypothetical protein
MSSFFGRYRLMCCLFSAILTLGLFSCRTPKQAVVRDPKKVEDKSAPDLQELIYRNSFNAKNLTAKASVKSVLGNQSNSFSINLRMQTDSVIWISISPLLGIEVFRAVITRDSVKYIDRLNNRFALTDFNYLNDLMQVNVDFDIIQGVLTGNLFAYRKNKFNSVYLEDGHYILSTLSKRKLKRSLEDIDISKPIVQDMWVESTHYRITKLSIEDHRAQKSLLTNYSDHRHVEGGLFPFRSQTQIKAGQPVKIDIEYSKLNVNTNPDFPFSIPASYERVY